MLSDRDSVVTVGVSKLGQRNPTDTGSNFLTTGEFLILFSDF